ncbi:hypothetical protein F5Y18DRAFT_423561 [Xylariaceae sp. FL1019]|nr:hypothetical protein F5Y18DRAFT_423561 [Xylariaceae sp. FL1019]
MAKKGPKKNPNGVQKRTNAKGKRNKPVRVLTCGERVRCELCSHEFDNTDESISSHFARQHPIKADSLAEKMKQRARCSETGCGHQCSANALIKHVKEHHGKTMSATDARKHLICTASGTNSEEDADDIPDGLTEEEKEKLGKGPSNEDDDDDEFGGSGGSGGAGGVSQLVPVA